MKLVHINLNEGILVDAINCTEWVILFRICNGISRAGGRKRRQIRIIR